MVMTILLMTMTEWAKDAKGEGVEITLKPPKDSKKNAASGPFSYHPSCRNHACLIVTYILYARLRWIIWKRTRTIGI